MQKLELSVVLKIDDETELELFVEDTDPARFAGRVMIAMMEAGSAMNCPPQKYDA